jgi:hypothetical protein
MRVSKGCLLNFGQVAHSKCTLIHPISYYQTIFCLSSAELVLLGSMEASTAEFVDELTSKAECQVLSISWLEAMRGAGAHT